MTSPLKLNLTPQDIVATSRGVAQYQRLASLLRHRIVNGDYPLGQQLPSITLMAAELGVAVVTVRQAYLVLAAEGLVRGERGRGTHVVALPSCISHDFQLAINDPFQVPDALAFKVLEVRHGAELPYELHGPHAQSAPIVCIRKVHTFADEPFCYAEIYLPETVFRALPRNLAKKCKVLPAVLNALGSRCQRVRQQITVLPAELQVATTLTIPFASPVARMSRRLVDSEGEVLYGGVTWYRGDRYMSEIDISVEALKAMPSIAEPKSPTSIPQKQ